MKIEDVAVSIPVLLPPTGETPVSVIAGNQIEPLLRMDTLEDAEQLAKTILHVVDARRKAIKKSNKLKKGGKQT